MTPAELTYQNMVERLPEAVPELRDRFQEERAWLSDKNLAYVIYEFVLYKHIEDLLKRPREDAPALERAFAFLETVLTHPDARVRDVGDQSVCEAICSDEVVLQKAQRYMGPAAKKSCAEYMSHRGEK